MKDASVTKSTRKRVLWKRLCQARSVAGSVESDGRDGPDFVEASPAESVG